MPRSVVVQKQKLLDEIEQCTGIELDRIGPGLRGALNGLSILNLYRVERAFKLAYQEGFDRAQLENTKSS